MPRRTMQNRYGHEPGTRYKLGREGLRPDKRPLWIPSAPKFDGARTRWQLVAADIAMDREPTR